MPGWADFNAGDIFYGFPDLENRGVKFANDKHGVLVDPDTQDRRPTQAAIDEIVAFRDRRFPGLRGAPLIGRGLPVREQFERRFPDRHPSRAVECSARRRRVRPRVQTRAGGGGHAAARLFEAVKEEPRFSLATKGETQHREVH